MTRDAHTLEHPGDGGLTRLASGPPLSKASARFEALGDLDELNCLLGLARAGVKNGSRILDVQNRLAVLAAEVAGMPGFHADQATVEELEAWARKAATPGAPPVDLVTPGGTEASARLDLARAVARRCERRLVGLTEAGELDNPHLLAWINRLSTFLWRLARAEETPP